MLSLLFLHGSLSIPFGKRSVSYTHLDVYKRQRYIYTLKKIKQTNIHMLKIEKMRYIPMNAGTRTSVFES